ncbi:MAG: aspartate kinase, partial [Myxococcales bacterium]|nr:aspartate kinase [Myxococcales bacterium]
MLIVQKYGGTSVGSVERIKSVASRVLATQRAGHQPVVVVSAMAGETNRLLALASEIGPVAPRELDVLLASGEQVSVALLASAIRAAGGDAVSLLAHQIRMRTDSSYSQARIHAIDGPWLDRAIEGAQIPIIAGFQGMDADGNVTTLGRGGSDTSAVA